MAPEFINEFEITYDVYKDWVKHPMGQKARRNKMKRLLWNFAGLLISAFLILLGMILPINAALFIGVAFMGAMLYLLIFSQEMATKKQYNLAVESNVNPPWKRTFTFSDVIQMLDFRTQADFKYSQIKQITEDNRCFYLWLNNDYVLRILKDAFTKGNTKTFRNYIEAKIKKKNKKSR